MALICPHCKKEVNPPYFRFCNYCNGNIKNQVDEFNKREEERNISSKQPISAPTRPIFMDFLVSEITDSSSFRAAFSNALQNSPIIGAIINAYSNDNFEEMREILKEAVDTINQLRKLDVTTHQFTNVDEKISGEESSVIKLLKNAKRFDATEDDIKTALDVFFSTLVINFLNLTISAIEKPKYMNDRLANLQLAQRIVKSTNFFLLHGFIESFLSYSYNSINNVLRAEDHQKQAIEAFKRAKNEELIKVAKTGLSNARYLQVLNKLFNSYFNQNKK